jgi:nucleoside-diphosphate-sugar epimerase
MSQTTIGIIGASGQVGTEVCLFLKTYPGIRVIAIVRSPVSAALLQRMGIECRIGTFDQEASCRELLEGCDLVADFSVVIGEVANTKRHYFNNITKALQYSPRHARYVFISTINAFGMSAEFNKAKWYLIPHSIYAVTKRYGERIAARHGKKYGKAVYSFRLGHVHGPLQRVSQETRELVNKKYRLFEYPDTPSYTVFCYSIAEGLVNVAAGRETPGVYTLVSEPAWSWKEVLEYYLENDRRIEVRLMATRKDSLLKRLPGLLKQGLFGLLARYKDSLRANVLHHFPDIEKKYKANLYIQRAHTQREAYLGSFVYRPEDVHEGVFPGNRLRHGTDSRLAMHEKTEQVKRMAEAIVPPSIFSQLAAEATESMTIKR